MASKTVYLNWDPQSKFVLNDRDNHQLRINGAGNIGSSDLLTMSLIGCSSYDVIEILGKQRQELHQLKVRAEAVQDDDPPWKFRKIHIHYQAAGRGLDPEKVRKAIQLSEEKYCSVYATLKDVIEISHDVEVTEA
ncbi:MAG: OsmC family protein [Chloroflexi bacterium]|nr:OsmC family protein [Chloroflexota bacterium]